jgi:hypothetical protein
MIGVLHQFLDDDAGYLAWLRTHPRGFVLNCGHPPSASYLMLHCASCHTITGTPTRGGSWTSAYQKVCAGTARELDQWALVATGGEVTRCGICQP